MAESGRTERGSWGSREACRRGLKFKPVAAAGGAGLAPAGMEIAAFDLAPIPLVHNGDVEAKTRAIRSRWRRSKSATSARP